MQLIKSNWLIIVVLLIAAVFRLYQLDEYPKAANQDELNNIYDSYSILKTGADRWNREHPILLRGFGNEGHPTALYSWLSIPFMKIAGSPDLYYGRLLSAVLGIISILFIYLFTKNTLDKNTALVAAIIAAFAPWPIIYSRVAIESSALPAFFIILIMYLWSVLRKNKYANSSIFLTGIVIGLSSSAYTASRISALLFAIVIFFEIMINHKEIGFVKTTKKLFFIFIAVVLGAMPQLYSFITETKLFMGRGEGVIMPFHPISTFITYFINNIYDNFELHYLFFDFPLHNNITIGRFYPYLSVLYLFGIFFIIKSIFQQKASKYSILLFSIFISVIPAALTYGNPIAIRCSALSLLIPIVCSISTEPLVSIKNRRYFYGIVLALFILNTAYFFSYFSVYKKNEGLMDPDKQHLLYLNAMDLNTYKQDASYYIIDYFGNQPYMYFLFFNKIEPEVFQQSKKINYTGASFDNLYQMDNYLFVNAYQYHQKYKTHPNYHKTKRIYISYNQKIEDLILLKTNTWMDDTSYLYTNKR